MCTKVTRTISITRYSVYTVGRIPRSMYELKFTHIQIFTYIFDRFEVEVWFVDLRGYIEHEVLSQLLIRSSKQLVEDVEVTLSVGTLGYTELLEEKRLKDGIESTCTCTCKLQDTSRHSVMKNTCIQDLYLPGDWESALIHVCIFPVVSL